MTGGGGGALCDKMAAIYSEMHKIMKKILSAEDIDKPIAQPMAPGLYSDLKYAQITAQFRSCDIRKVA